MYTGLPSPRDPLGQLLSSNSPSKLSRKLCHDSRASGYGVTFIDATGPRRPLRPGTGHVNHTPVLPRRLRSTASHQGTGRSSTSTMQGSSFQVRPSLPAQRRPSCGTRSDVGGSAERISTTTQRTDCGRVGFLGLMGYCMYLRSSTPSCRCGWSRAADAGAPPTLGARDPRSSTLDPGVVTGDRSSVLLHTGG